MSDKVSLKRLDSNIDPEGKFLILQKGSKETLYQTVGEHEFEKGTIQNSYKQQKCPNLKTGAPFGSSSFSNVSEEKIYQIFNTPPDSNENHEYDSKMYPEAPEIQSDFFTFKTKLTGILTEEDTFGRKISDLLENSIRTNTFSIHFKYIIHKETINVPWFILIHGVPSNSQMKIGIMKRLAPFGNVIAIDLLGMGKSDKPIDFDDWRWNSHAEYLDLFITHIKTRFSINSDPFIQGDDWGAGVAMAYAGTKKQYRGLILVNAVALDGYPVQEIGDIGRMSNIPKEDFDATNSNFSSTVQQILKTMVYKSHVFNTFTEHDFFFPYINSQRNSGRNASQDKYNSWNIYVLAQFAAMLNPEWLLPEHFKKNEIGNYEKAGITFSNFKTNVKIIWGKKDNMMAVSNAQKLAEIIIRKAKRRCEITLVEKAGHLVEAEKPDDVATSMINYFRNETMGENFPIFFGIDKTVVYKGTESKEMRDLEQIGFSRRHYQ